MGTSKGHGEGSGSSAVLGLDDLVTSELDALGEGLEVGLSEASVLDLGEEGENGGSGVSSDDGDVDVLNGPVLVLGDKGVGTSDVEGGDTKELLGVVGVVLLQDLAEDGDGGVDRVGDDRKEGVRAVLGAGLGNGGDDGSVGVEEIVTGHSGLAGDSGGDDDGGAALESGGNVLLGVALDASRRVDVGQVSGDSGDVDDVVESEVSDEGVDLQEEGQGLSNLFEVKAVDLKVSAFFHPAPS